MQRGSSTSGPLDAVVIDARGSAADRVTALVLEWRRRGTRVAVTGIDDGADVLRPFVDLVDDGDVALDDLLAGLSAAPRRTALVTSSDEQLAAAREAGLRTVAVAVPDAAADVHADALDDVDADEVLWPGCRWSLHLPGAFSVSSGWEVAEHAWDRERIMTAGSNYLVGNGYLGYRGTFPEWTADEFVGCIVADTYDTADGKWRELCAVPNGLFAEWTAGDEPLVLTPEHPAELATFHRELNLRHGVHRRAWSRGTDAVGDVMMTDERFASLDVLHLVVQRQTVSVERDGRLSLRAGIDGHVWSLHGDHFASCATDTDGDVLVTEVVTVEDRTRIVVATGHRLQGPPSGDESVGHTGRSVMRDVHVDARAGVPAVLDTVMAVVTDRDTDDPRAAAVGAVRDALDAGYARLLLAHAAHWETIWADLDVRIDGDPASQTLLRFNLYHNTIANPAHSEHLPISARGLSSQAYQGSAFWDQEIFNLPMFLFTRPEQARRILGYRWHTLDGARRKARRLGYDGAFYAWVSGRTGDELCPSLFFTDVLSGREIRNHFNDWQIHVSPDIAYAIGRYVAATGDWAFVVERGAEILFEIARFLASRVSEHPGRGRYDIERVLGPDEYHENVDNNAFTNRAAAHALDLALRAHARMSDENADTLRRLSAALDLTGDELERWRDVRDRLVQQQPDPDTGVIEQFDGFLTLEDVMPDEVEQRLLDPREYWGWPNGVAVRTQVSKQADVIQLLLQYPDIATDEVLAANYDYYFPRTQHGSSLSRSAYAVIACRLGRIQEARRHFMASAGVDLFASQRGSAGGTYIGGIHTAACGAGWQVAVHGFAGLEVLGDQLDPGDPVIGLAPRLPRQWQRLTFRVIVQGRRATVSCTHDGVDVAADADNSGPVTVRIADAAHEVAPGHRVVAAAPTDR